MVLSLALLEAISHVPLVPLRLAPPPPAPRAAFRRLSVARGGWEPLPLPPLMPLWPSVSAGTLLATSEVVARLLHPRGSAWASPQHPSSSPSRLLIQLQVLQGQPN